MRLLNVNSLEFKEFWGDDAPKYYILSHRWEDDEATYTSFAEHQRRSSKGYQKIIGFRDAIRYRAPHIEWLWIDTACIDKTNMVELPEAINSMFRWYRDAECCFAYLQDIESRADVRKSAWFCRGWTLQELLAPPTVMFFNQYWKYIGSKPSSASSEREFGNEELSVITGIPSRILTGFDPVAELDIRRNLSWMNHRQTTRPEDRYYSMLGIFGVYMLPIYGEGSEHAYQRLVKEIWNEHGLDSKVDRPQFHPLSLPYDGLLPQVWVRLLNIRLPQNIFIFNKDLSGTLYIVIKRQGNYMKIYEDGMIGAEVAVNGDDPDGTEKDMRQKYHEAGRNKLGTFRDRITGSSRPWQT